MSNYASGLSTYDVMSKYGRSYDYPHASEAAYSSYDPRSRSRDLGSRTGVTTGMSGYGGTKGTSGYDIGGTPSFGTSYGTSYDVGTKSHDVKSSSYGNSTRIGDAGTRYGSYSTR